MPNFTVDWHSHNIPHWRRILDRYKGQPNVRALEIGSFEGRSTVWLLENILTHETARIDCIDTFEGSVEHTRMGVNVENLLSRFLGNTEPHAKKIGRFIGRSQDVLRSGDFCPYEVYSYDFIYIDGSHKAADVLEDAVLSFRLLKVGGLIIFDDYAWNGGGPTEFDNPRRGIEAFYYAYQNQLERTHVYYQAVFQKVSVESRGASEPNLARLGALELVNQLAS
jgi:predicted O-methyltransferase YrrM